MKINKTLFFIISSIIALALFSFNLYQKGIAIAQPPLHEIQEEYRNVMIKCNTTAAEVC